MTAVKNNRIIGELIWHSDTSFHIFIVPFVPLTVKWFPFHDPALALNRNEREIEIRKYANDN